MDGDNNTRESIYYPELFPITLTHGEFPSNETVHDAMTMTYGLMVTPFIATDEGSSLLQYNPKLQSHRSSGVARCDHCGGYINPFCDSTSLRWICSLCDTRNSFARNMLRYRQVDLRLLPEMQHLLLDYPLPLSTGEDGDAGSSAEESANKRGINKKKKKKTSKEEKRKAKSHSKYHCPSSERPLVHVLLVQESMSLDCLQAAIDAISDATNAHPDTGLHPDIEIVLLTFSNRIGIYRLHRDDVDVCRDTTSTAASTYLLPACIQYSHFSLEKVVHDDSNLASYHSQQSQHQGDQSSSDGGVFDGQNSREFLSLATDDSTSASTSASGSSSPPSVQRVCPLLALNEISSFDDVRVPIGDVRNSLRTSLSALYDASPSVPSSASTGASNEYAAYEQQGQASAGQSESLHGPLVMLGKQYNFCPCFFVLAFLPVIRIPTLLDMTSVLLWRCLSH
jgi:hypothetical protein